MTHIHNFMINQLMRMFSNLSVHKK